MFLVPSAKLKEKLDTSRVGLWVEHLYSEKEVALASKLPTNVIKAVYRGAKCSVVVSVVEVEQVHVLCVGLQVADEEEHPFTVVNPFMDEAEQFLVEKFLTYQSVDLYFFDELSQPVLGTICFFDHSQAKKARNELKRTKPYYLGMSNDTINSLLDLSQVVEEALDIFQKGIYISNSSKPPMTLFKKTIPVSLTISKPIPTYTITTGSTVKTIINNNDEGGGQEQLIYAFIEYVYPGHAFHSPKIRKGKIERELTDIMGFGSNTICLVQSKAVSILGIEMNKASKKRAASLEKHINKALKQSKGAIKKIRSGADVFSKDGQIINIPERKSSLIHAIILISEMYSLVNWRKVAEVIINDREQDKYKALFHIYDLQEFQYIANYSKNAKEFNSLLIQHWVEVKKKKNVYIRGKHPIKLV